MSETVLVYQQRKAEIHGPDDELALNCVSEFLNEPLHAYQADFLSDAGCLCVSRSQGILLSFFFKNADFFLSQIGRILSDYAKSSKRHKDILSKYPYVPLSPEAKVKVFVFVPAYDESWGDFSALLRVPIQIIPFMTVASRSHQAVVLETDKKVNIGDPASIPFQPALMETRESAPEKIEDEISVEPEPAPQQSQEVPRSRARVSESYFQRAKLSSEEIRALLDFELFLDDIRAGTARSSI